MTSIFQKGKMQNLYDEVGSLDQRCYEEFGLSEDILMEHAAEGMARYIRQHFPPHSSVLIVTGSGNNGADGITLARLLHKEYDTSLCLAKEPKSPMAQLQHKRVQNIGVQVVNELHKADVIVDAIVGTGFRGEFDADIGTIIQTLNSFDVYKIACDIPSGVQSDGSVAQVCFSADTTLTMGALKKSLFSDMAKDCVGEIEVVELGVSRGVYEQPSLWHLLDLSDAKLPHRAEKNTHKGSFGHLAIACGQKSGASIIASSAALRFGAGLVTLVGYENEHTLSIPHTLMYSHALPANTTAIALGMGLGYEFSDTELDTLLDNSLPLIADADIFHMQIIKKILTRDSVVLTPHPKEFVSLLKATSLADISVEELQSKRFYYAELFSKHYPNVVLLLKGANVIIACGGEYFINPYGSAKLAKGGSGDVLSGLIGALLAQGYTPKDAAITASLTHTRLAQNYTGADFSLTPDDLIEGLGKL